MLSTIDISICEVRVAEETMSTLADPNLAAPAVPGPDVHRPHPLYPDLMEDGR